MAIVKKKSARHLKEKFTSLGIKLTKQREIISEVFFSSSGHLNAEEILKLVRKTDENISLATVYRTLKILQEHGLATSHNFKDGQALFEPCFGGHDHHDHLICMKCNKIIEFVNEKIESLQNQIANKHGFIVTDYKLELYGLCKKCKKN